MKPVRTCVGCRQRSNPSDLLRVVLVAGQIVPDAKAVSPGRGAWLHPSVQCFKLANDRKAFGRAFKVSGNFDTAGLLKHIEQAETMLDI
ncbi:MAG: YlxR family protein [Micrococcales bacterium]